MPEIPREDLIPKVAREPRMSPMRRLILIYIKDVHSKSGKAPSIRQIAAEFHKSPSTIHFHVEKLNRMGRIRVTRYHRIEVIEE